MNGQKKSAFAAQIPLKNIDRNCPSILSSADNFVKGSVIPGLDHDLQNGEWVATSYWKAYKKALMIQAKAKVDEAKAKRAAAKAATAIGGGLK